MVGLLAAQAWAKGPVVSITIKSRSLSEPVVITSEWALARFHFGRGPGFVYLPGKEDPRYDANVWLIYRGGIEGNWFHAWSEWDALFERLTPKR